MSGRVDLHLRIRVSREKRAVFDAFLREAIPFYEAPGGIRVRLVEDEGDPTRLIEIVEYASVERYLADRERVTNDGTMQAYLERWRALLDGPAHVEVYHEQDEGLRSTSRAVGVGGTELRTERLVLRPFYPSDAQAVVELAGDRRVAAMTLTVPHPYERHHAEGWIASHEGQRAEGTGEVFAVCERSGQRAGALVGAVGLAINKAHERAELGYWIGVPHWGRGYATEASIELVRYGFEALGLNRIYACHFAVNPASGRVLEKAGLKREGLSPRHVNRMGEFHDAVHFGIGRTEWKAGAAVCPMKS
jgi:RimJ/RimL family protein N-acetyltransferase/quinol monooxygenase YgiN